MKDNITEDDKPVHKTSLLERIKGAMDERISIGALLSRWQRWDSAESLELLLWHLSTSIVLYVFMLL